MILITINLWYRWHGCTFSFSAKLNLTSITQKHLIRCVILPLHIHLVFVITGSPIHPDMHRYINQIAFVYSPLVFKFALKLVRREEEKQVLTDRNPLQQDFNFCGLCGCLHSSVISNTQKFPLWPKIEKVLSSFGHLTCQTANLVNYWILSHLEFVWC